MVFAAILLLSLLFSLAVLGVLVGDQLTRGLPVFAERGVDFLTSDLSSNPAKAGVAQGLIGTALLVAIVALIAFPIGILTAIYLEEYAAGQPAHPVHRHQHPEPGRRAVGRLRPARPGHLRGPLRGARRRQRRTS